MPLEVMLQGLSRLQAYHASNPSRMVECPEGMLEKNLYMAQSMPGRPNLAAIGYCYRTVGYKGLDTIAHNVHNSHKDAKSISVSEKATQSFQVLCSIQRMEWMYLGRKFLDEVYGIHLQLVSYSGIASLLRKLPKSAPVDTRTAAGRTPLLYAAQQRYAAVGRALVEHGAALDFYDSQSYQPIAYAATYGHASILRLLSNHGALASAEFLNGTTGLFLVISYNREEGITVLLSSGAGTITKGRMGEPQVSSISLIDAVFYDRVLVARFLLDNDTELDFQDLEG
ncbi:ankyrin repeat-containing domain protein [Aspergillus carlsbadensis]|nr:ankyrin repeat-containing domain protein [Aspergillus carlsbadensis]